MLQNLSKKLFILALLGITFLIPNFVSAEDPYVIIQYVDAKQALESGGNVTPYYGMTVSQLIYQESVEHNISPKVLLTLFQRESSAISQTSPSSTTREGWPLFYNYDERMANCLNGDISSCNDAKYGKPTYEYRAINYGGVGQQIAYSMWNFQRLSDLYAGSYNSTINIDGQNINCSNLASRILYAYTPHISAYDSNSNFYTYYNQYWGSYPTETLSKNEIISENNFRQTTNPMTVEEIQNFLNANNSWLKNYKIDANGFIPEYVKVAYPAVFNPTPQQPSRKAGDANSDGSVESTDLSILADQWGKQVDANTGADFNGDGNVESTDLSIFADAWGK